MLSYSRQYDKAGAILLLGDATATALPAESFDLVVSSLGDPYNSPEFWREVKRLLRPTGTCLFTTPSPEWASRFRSAHEATNAEFVLSDGRKLWVRSHIPDQATQEGMIEHAGLRIAETEGISVAGLSDTISPKLRVSDDPTLPVVRGYVVQR
jgi:SAM-dependent methyltransferase